MKDSIMVGPALCSPHRARHHDITDVSLPENDIVKHVPLFGARMCPCCLVFVRLLEDDVGDG